MACNIIVNGEDATIGSDTLSFGVLVHLIGMGDQGMPTVTYRNGPQENQEGSLLPGQRVRVREGMIFNVRVTGNA